MFTGLVGASVEAWVELRANRLRVLLSLIGVAVAVAALAGVVAAGALAGQASRESSERFGGRPASFRIDMTPTGPVALRQNDADDAVDQAMSRYGIEFWSHADDMQRSVQFPTGVIDVPAQVVDVPFAAMHRIGMLEGEWFHESDRLRLAPGLVVNEAFWRELGAPDLATHPTVTLSGHDEVDAVVIGVVRSNQYDAQPSMFVLPSDRVLADPSLDGSSPDGVEGHVFEMWLPPKTGDRIAELVHSDLAQSLGASVAVQVNRQDYLQEGAEDPTVVLTRVVSGVALLILLLGGLGLVNVSLVTVKQRIRDIGVLRSFGATAPRVFFSVMLESVVGTTVAGLIGVGAAIILIGSSPVQGFLTQGALVDSPPFPMDAAMTGLAAAIGVGAIAGLLPAFVAVKVKVIDAVRY